MRISTVKAHVKPDYIDAFIQATLVHQANTWKEPGNLRMDFLQNRDDPTCFLFYEVYESEADIWAHREAASYKTWFKTVEPWMAEPRSGTGFKAVSPGRPREFGYPSAE